MSDFSHRKYVESGVEVVELRSPSTVMKIAVGIGNMLYSVERHGSELLYFPFTLEDFLHSDKLGGNPFMHPWANRLEGDHITIRGQRHDFPEAQKHCIYRDGNGLPLHGLLLKTDRWKTQAIKETEDFIYHHATLDFDDPEWLALFPFPHRLEMKTYLHEDELCVEVGVSNTGDQPMPLSFGFHPYFLIDPRNTEMLRLTIPLQDVLETDDKQIPTGERLPKGSLWPFENDEISLDTHRFDHGFTGQDRKRFYHFKQDMREFDLFLDNDYNFVQVYAPNQPDKPYVCIEPMLAPTNALNSGNCKFLQPGATTTQAFTLSFYDEQFRE